MNYYAILNDSDVVIGAVTTPKYRRSNQWIPYDPEVEEFKTIIGSTYDRATRTFTAAPIRVIRKDAWVSRMTADEIAMLRGLYDTGVAPVVGFYDWLSSQPNTDLDNPRYLAFFTEVVSHYPADQTLIDLARAQAILADGTVDEL